MLSGRKPSLYTNQPGGAETLTSRSTGTAKIPSIKPEGYISGYFALREKRRRWPNLWQAARREEGIPSRGDYHTYDIADESISLARAVRRRRSRPGYLRYWVPGAPSRLDRYLEL
jgi:hypothetical protein